MTGTGRGFFAGHAGRFAAGAVFFALAALALGACSVAPETIGPQVAAPPATKPASADAALSPAELRTVRDHERRNANRKSVLAAIDRKLP